MHVVFLTRNTQPVVCGIGDHTSCLAAELSARGVRTTIVGGSGSADQGRYIIPKFWSSEGRRALIKCLKSLRPIDLLVLQFTPLAYARWRGFSGRAVIRLWEHCANQWSTSMIVHETYYRSMRHPPSLVRGTLEKALLHKMTNASRYVFTSSEPLLRELRTWNVGSSLTWLPIGSNIGLTIGNRGKHRAEAGLSPEHVVITLFGGGASLYNQRDLVTRVDRALSNARMRVRWLLLGNINPAWFTLRHTPITPGVCTAEIASLWLQASDLLLVPHRDGISLKRGSVIAAMEHSLPIVGTKGRFTDDVWLHASGAELAETTDSFVSTVDAFVKSDARRERAGTANRELFLEKFTWSKIAEQFLDRVSR